jgi:hypothetical protein
MRPELPILIKARAKIADPENWGKGFRTVCGGHRTLETCCASEAIEAVAATPGLRSAALRALAAAAQCDTTILRWNDAPERTHAQVLAAFDKAIASAS